MSRLTNSLGLVFYRRLAKPILFKISPDKVHDGMVATGSFLQKFTIFRFLMRAAFSYDDQILRQSLLKQEFKNPLGLSAGLDKNIALAPTMSAVGFGFMEGGTISNLACAGNPRPWFYRLAKSQSLVVHAGLPNHGVDKILPVIKHNRPFVGADFKLNISVAPSNVAQISNLDLMIEDCIVALQKIAKSQLANMITINLSCPNTCGGEPFTVPNNLDKLLSHVDSLKLNVPLFLKMPQQTIAQQNRLLEIILTHQVAGITVANLIKDRAQAQLQDDLPDSILGGISGKPTFESSNRLIKNAYQKSQGKLIIIGVGGVFSAQDAYLKIRAGASLVELISGLIFEGPALIGQINRQLAELLRRDGFENVAQAVGVDAR